MKKILILSTTFFPDQQVAAIRMTQWCRLLPEHGWKPYVLCRYYGFEATPEELATQVHPEVSVSYLDRPAANERGETMMLSRRRLRRWIEPLLAHGTDTLAVPDVSIYAWRRFRAQILSHVRVIQPDVILTTSPPHSNHDIGMWLTRETGIPWVADFRDPYMIDERFRPRGIGKLRWAGHRRFKEAIYGRARLVTHAIPLQARWARRFVPLARPRVRILTNAFPKDWLNELSARQVSSGNRKTVLVTGTIPEPEQVLLAKAVAQLAARGCDVQLKLIGMKHACESQMRELLGARLVHTGYVSHRESIRAVSEADVLVNFLNEFRSHTLLLSTKLFEYLASGKPVICANPSRSDRLLLHGRAGVQALKPPGVEEMAQAIKRSLEHGSRRPGDEVEKFRDEFNWSARVTQLAKWLDELVAFPPAVPQRSLGKPAASIVIPTRNRKELLPRVLRAALSQSVPVEVIVMDDGSTDGTMETLPQMFPEVQFHRLAQNQGPCFQRNRGVKMATTNFVFAIDDDSVFSSPRVVEQTLKEFENPRVAAVGIPFMNVRHDMAQHQHSPGDGKIHGVHAFVGAAHAVRRDVFLKVGGYREHFFYMGEEGDLCLRMLNEGYVTRMGRADPIQHFESPLRNSAQAAFCGRRNDILFAWHNVPSPHFPFHLIGTTLNGLGDAFTSGSFWPMIRGIASGYWACLRGDVERRPVSAAIYRLHRSLKKEGAKPVSDFEKQLPVSTTTAHGAKPS